MGYRWWKVERIELKAKECGTLLHEMSYEEGRSLTMNPYVGCSHRCVYCVTPDTPILLEEGPRPALEVVEGDRVLTHRGRYKPILRIIRHHYQGSILRLRPYLVEVPLGLTPDQLLLVEKGGGAHWIEARSLRRGDRLLLSIPDGGSLNLPYPYRGRRGLVAQLESMLGQRYLEVPLREVHEEPYRGPVYDFEVQEDGSFSLPYATLHNCYATYEWSPDFYDRIYYKENAPEVLEEELRKGSWRSLGGKGRERGRGGGGKGKGMRPVFLASATDSYQAAEGRLRLTRRCVELLQKYGVPYYIITKSSSIVRDLELHARYKDRCIIIWSLITLDEGLKRRIEPYASSAQGILRALRLASERGVTCCINIDPIIPNLTDGVEHLKRLVVSCIENGARHIGAGVLRLRKDIWDRLKGLLLSLGREGDIKAIARLYFTKPTVQGGYYLADEGYRRRILGYVRRLVEEHGGTFGFPTLDVVEGNCGASMPVRRGGEISLLEFVGGEEDPSGPA